MTTSIRASVLTATLAAGLCLLPVASNQAVAQITFSVRGVTPTYYNAYGSRYTYGYGRGFGLQGYTVYGNGPYGYGLAVPYAYHPARGYGYRGATSYHLNNRLLQFQVGNYPPAYRPYPTRHYSPYGYGYGYGYWGY